jgi:hypothetical protein
LLACIHVVILAYSLNRNETFEEIVVSAIRGFNTYVLGYPFLIGIPGMLLGAFFGTLICFLLRKVLSN